MNQSFLSVVLILMRKLYILIMVVIVVLLAGVTGKRNAVIEVKADSSPAIAQPHEVISSFEKAVEIIKKYETLHQPKNWPLVGYGHKVLPGEKFSRTKALSEKEADELLRKDLLKNCAIFREFGPDSLLLGVLAYNIGSGAAKRSAVARKLAQGNRDIRATYLSYSKYRGKTHSGIKQRRAEEFETLFVDDPIEESIATIPDSISQNKYFNNRHLALCTSRFQQF